MMTMALQTVSFAKKRNLIVNFFSKISSQIAQIVILFFLPICLVLIIIQVCYIGIRFAQPQPMALPKQKKKKKKKTKTKATKYVDVIGGQVEEDSGSQAEKQPEEKSETKLEANSEEKAEEQIDKQSEEVADKRKPMYERSSWMRRLTPKNKRLPLPVVEFNQPETNENAEEKPAENESKSRLHRTASKRKSVQMPPVVEEEESEDHVSTSDDEQQQTPSVDPTLTVQTDDSASVVDQVSDSECQGQYPNAQYQNRSFSPNQCQTYSPVQFLNQYLTTPSSNPYQQQYRSQ